MRYIATISREGTAILADFPDCKGCQTFVRKGDDETIEAKASEALHDWLEAQLVAGAEVPFPSQRVRIPKGATSMFIDVSPTLAIKIALRLERQRSRLTQADVAARAGLTQQQVALVESPSSNPSLKTLEKVARALGTRIELQLRPA